MNTDYNLYKIFLYLFEEKSISKTANKLYVSQPAISYSLKELEKQLGYTLFTRNSKGIEPTNEAKELYGYISTAFHILDDAEEHIKSINNLDVGHIRIGVSTYLGSSYVCKFIDSFHKLYPGIQFDIITKSSEEMIEMLQTRKLDVVLDISNIYSQNNISKVNLEQLDTSFVYHRSNVIDTKYFYSNSFILPSIESLIRLKLNDYLEKDNISITSLIDSNSLDNILELTKKGLGIGYLPNIAISSLIDKDDFVIMDKELPKIDVNLIYIEDFLSTVVLKFIDLLSERHI